MASYLVKSDLVGDGNVRGKGFLPSTANGELVVHEQLNSLLEGLSWKDNARVASTANINLASPGATIDGITMTSGDRVLVKNQTTQTENGIYIWNGAASAMTRALDADTFSELESAVISVDEGTAGGGTSWRQSAVNGVLGTNNVVWGGFGVGSPAASTSVAGVAALATQSEVDAGSVTDKIVTPNTLANWSGRFFRFAATIGNGSATQYDVTHNLSASDVIVQVYDLTSNSANVLCEVRRLTVNSVRLIFNTAAATNQYRVVIHY